MCGILGLVNLRGERDVERIEAARDVLSHRGPDGAGLWTCDIGDEAHVALAHRRLRILDLTEKAAQPLLLDCDDCVRPARVRERGDAHIALLFNGEIYNFVELRSELCRAGFAFSSTGDTEVLLRAYQHWGEACVEHLNGMFSFAAWDNRTRTLFCARDRFGEKPFHYIIDEERGIFAFASEIKALVALGIRRPALDATATYRFLRFGELAGASQSIWSDVKRLQAGHCMRVSVTSRGLDSATSAYWMLDEAHAVECDDATAREQFASAFRESVRIRLRSDAALGTSLSGGLDSSSVICQIHALGSSSAQMAFTARMDDPRLDEGAYVADVLKATGIPGASVRPRAEAFVEDLDTLCYYQEEPFPTTSIFASYIVQRLAQQHGVTVLLDGQGADEYLAGYAHYPAVLLTDLARRGRFPEWYVERAAAKAAFGIDPVPPKAAIRLFAKAFGRSAHSLLVDTVLSDSVLEPEFSHAHAGEEPRSIPVRSDALGARLYADLCLGHLQELLRYADRNSMAHSRELRLPFLDHRLVELVWSLPRRNVYSHGETKRVLRRAMQSIVPDTILRRRDKIGFATPWMEWWNGESGEILRNRLTEAERSLQGIIRPGVARPGSRDALSIISLAGCRTQLSKMSPCGAH